MDPQHNDELNDLLGALRDGTLTDDQTARLDEVLVNDADARRYYLEFISLHADLRQYYGAGTARGLRLAACDPAPDLKPQASSLKPLRALALAAMIALAASLMTIYLTPEPQLPLSVVAEKGGVAVLTRVADAKWKGGTVPLGSALQPGTMTLESGLAQIEFYSGATVVLEGPAEFQIVSAQRGVFTKGKVRAHVPPQARGFTLAAAGVDVVDLGTEFGLSIDEAGQSEVHVFEGEVRLKEGKTETARLTTGQALRGIEGKSQVIEADDRAFVSPMGLAVLSDESVANRRALWAPHTQKLRQDPGVILYYTFEDQQPWDRVIQNHVGTREVGAIVGAQWSQGRWPGKGALEFKRTSDRIRVNVPGSHPAMTFAAWVRFDGFDRSLSALMLTDGWEAGEPHWQVSWDGEMILGINTSTGGINYYSGKGVLGAADLGRWVHLATVYDPAGGRVTHYVDGRAVATTARPLAGADPSAPLVPLRIGPAEVGNWAGLGPTPVSDAQSTRNLNGRIDELALFNRALTADEVKGMYESGKPQL